MLRVHAKWLMCMFGVFVFVTQALAVNPDEVLSDAGLEARARALSTEIRCLVCQNQSIDDSDAQLARDLRILVREKLVEGLEDQEILDFLVERYGEFVLLKPRFGFHTLALWGVPILAILAGFFAIRGMFSRTPATQVAPSALSKDEEKELSKILDE